MTEKQDRAKAAKSKAAGLRRQAAEQKVRAMRDRQFAPAREALARLSNADLAELLWSELDRRRLDEHGNPRDPEGLYLAVVAGLDALLGLTPMDAALAQNVAAVGRGIRVRSPIPEASVIIREIARDLEANWSNFPDQARALTKTYEKRYGRRVSLARVVSALAQRGKNKRIEALAGAIGIETSENSIKSALRK